MARGVNSWTGTGNVGGDILFGDTNRGDSFCSFQVACEDKMSEVTWVRCNAYGVLADICKKKLRRGGYVAVDGELMNRSDGPETVEVRCKEMVFLPGGRHDKNDERE